MEFMAYYFGSKEYFLLICFITNMFFWKIWLLKHTIILNFTYVCRKKHLPSTKKEY